MSGQVQGTHPSTSTRIYTTNISHQLLWNEIHEILPFMDCLV